MFRKTIICALGVATLGAVSPLALAEISADQAARLSKDLTPLGAIRAGNEAGTIPAWYCKAPMATPVTGVTRTVMVMAPGTIPCTVLTVIVGFTATTTLTVIIIRQHSAWTSRKPTGNGISTAASGVSTTTGPEITWAPAAT